MISIAYLRHPKASPNIGDLPAAQQHGLDALYRMTSELIYPLDCPKQLIQGIETLGFAVRGRPDIPLETIVEILAYFSTCSWPWWQNHEKGWSKLAHDLRHDIVAWQREYLAHDGRHQNRP